MASTGEDCKKYPTPDARLTCELKYKESATDFQKFSVQKKDADNDAEGGASKKYLCFKQSSGDVLCPN